MLCGLPLCENVLDVYRHWNHRSKLELHLQVWEGHRVEHSEICSSFDIEYSNSRHVVRAECHKALWQSAVGPFIKTSDQGETTALPTRWMWSGVEAEGWGGRERQAWHTLICRDRGHNSLVKPVVNLVLNIWHSCVHTIHCHPTSPYQHNVRPQH